MSDREPIRESPTPQYSEREQLERIARADTGELPIIVGDPEKALQLFAVQLLKRNRTRIAAALLGLAGVGGEGYSTWRSHDRADVMEYKVKTLLESNKELEKRLRRAENGAARCGCLPGEDP